MRDRKLYFLLAKHAGHELVVKERDDGKLAAPHMRVSCTRCKTVVMEMPPPRSLLRARVETDELPPRPRRATHPEMQDDYFADA